MYKAIGSWAVGFTFFSLFCRIVFRANYPHLRIALHGVLAGKAGIVVLYLETSFYIGSGFGELSLFFYMGGLAVL